MVTGSQTEQGVVRVPLGTWNIDPTHSSVEFSIKHLMIATVRGRFRDFEGTIEAAEDINDSKSWASSGRPASTRTSRPGTSICAGLTSSTPSAIREARFESRQ